LGNYYIYHFHHLIIDKIYDESTLYREIRKLEVLYDSYIDETGNPFNNESLSIYSTLSARDS